MICTYLPRVVVHPDRYGSARPMPPRWIVLHTSEQTSELPATAESLARYMTTPGDRPTSSGGRYGSSYHHVVDTGLRVRPCVVDGFVSFSAPGSNTEGLHVCLPALAGQTRDDWLDEYSRDLIRTTAGLCVDLSELFGIPPLRLTTAELRAGTRGITDHNGIRLAFGRTTHWDVGPAFPWDVLAADIREFSRPTQPNPEPETEDDEMNRAIAAIYSPTDAVTVPNPKTFGLLPDGSVRHVSGPDVEYATEAGAPTKPIRGDEHYRQLDELDALWRARNS